MNLDKIHDRCKGALYGLAIGDALGAAVEFKYPGEFPPVTCYRSGGPHRLAAGQWTDDTSMALALADSIIHKGWDLDDQIKRYVDWWQNGTYSVNGECFDIGTTTRMALNEYVFSGNVHTCADRSPESSGNGSIMRLAPVAIYGWSYYPFDLGRLLDMAEQSSVTTHASKQCKDCCRFMAYLLAALINGEEKDKVLEGYQATSVPVVDTIVRGSYKLKSENTIVGGGWVVQSLEAALWAFYRSYSFEEAVLRAVNLGNDSDTTGAVCGQIAGAYYGYSAIPKHLIDGLDRKDMIDKAINGLLSI